MNIDIKYSSSSRFQKFNLFNISRNKNKLISIKKYNDYLKTLNNERNRNDLQKYEKRIFFTNKEIKSHFNDDIFKPDSRFNKNLLIKELKNNSILKYNKFINPKLKMNVETNINTVKHVNPNLSINKVNFNISKTYSNNDVNDDQLRRVKKKLKKIRYQSYNEYNMKRQLKDKKKSFSEEKDNESTINPKNSIKPNDYFRIFKLKKSNINNNNIKYNSVKTQIKMDNILIDKKIMKTIDDNNNIFDNISNKIGVSNFKIKLYNIVKRTKSKVGISSLD
jgi:hypothetical protein